MSNQNSIPSITTVNHKTSVLNKSAPTLSYPKLDVWATRVDKAEVNSTASHTGQLVGCWRAESCIMEDSGYTDTGQQLEAVAIPQSNNWIRKASYGTLDKPRYCKLPFSRPKSVMHAQRYYLNSAFNWPAESKKRSSEEKVRHCTSPLWWNKVVRQVPFWTFQMQMRLLAPWPPPDADANVWTRFTHRENEYRSHSCRGLSGISRSAEVYRQKHQLIALFFHSNICADNLRRLWWSQH